MGVRRLIGDTDVEEAIRIGPDIGDGANCLKNGGEDRRIDLSFIVQPEQALLELVARGFGTWRIEFSRSASRPSAVDRVLSKSNIMPGP